MIKITAYNKWILTLENQQEDTKHTQIYMVWNKPISTGEEELIFTTQLKSTRDVRIKSSENIIYLWYSLKHNIKYLKKECIDSFY